MKSIEEFNQYVKKIKKDSKIRIVVGMASCGIAVGAGKVYNKLKEKITKEKIASVDVVSVGCIGICRLEPIVEIYENNKKTTYINVKEDMVDKIIESHIIKKEIVKDFLIDKSVLSLNELEFYKKQTRIVLRNCGIINPEDINEYIAAGGYSALVKVLSKMSPKEVIEEVKKSGLRGRGGAGFPTGTKWENAYNSVSDTKYVCCNADEGDPGAFMDRAVLEGDPHSVIEAMIIAGYAVGGNSGYIYVRAEYPLAVKRIQNAIEQAKELHLLGKNILGTKFSFDLNIRLGAGAFVCGEETALMVSIEGKRGEPRPRPPYPTYKGLFGMPTLLNNVETYANIAQIINKGSNWYKKLGTEKSKGTKVFALGGKITNTGLVEVPIGTTLNEVINNIGGGVPNNKKFKAAQIGGPSGGCIPNSLINTPLDYEPLIELGSMMGSGGLIVIDEDACMVDIAKYFLEFTVDESCGKCVPCRIGTSKILDYINDISLGKSDIESLKQLEELCVHVKGTSLCGLGQSAPNPVLSNLRHFKEEYLLHVINKECPAKVCKSLITYNIDKEKCVGCGMCARNCPVNTIEGELKKPYTIIQDKCIKCGKCFNSCKFGAIYKGGLHE